MLYAADDKLLKSQGGGEFCTRTTGVIVVLFGVKKVFLAPLREFPPGLNFTWKNGSGRFGPLREI